MRKRRLVLVVLVVLFWLAWQSQSYYSDRRARLSSVTAHSTSATGMSIFQQLSERTKPGQARLHQVAFLDRNALEEVEDLAVYSPKKMFSPHEAQLVADFVEQQGGRLLLSFHNETTHAALSPLLSALEIPVPIEEDKEFRNNTAVLFSPPSGDGLFRSEEQYAFYSRWRMKGKDCSSDPWECYVKEQKAGRGEVLIFASFPPVSNALIPRADNAKLAFRLIERAESIAFDEYHHFFTDKTFADLLATPEFLLPLLGFLGIVLLFFVFGYSEYHETAMEATPPAPTSSHHRFYEKVVQGVIVRSHGLQEGIALQTAFMRRAFPRERGQIDAEERRLAEKYGDSGAERDLLAKAARFITLHRKILTQRGSLKN